MNLVHEATEYLLRTVLSHTTLNKYVINSDWTLASYTRRLIVYKLMLTDTNVQGLYDRCEFC